MRGVHLQLTIPQEQFEKITRLLKEYDYPTVQDFIREAVREHVNGKINTMVKRTAIYHGRREPKLPHGDKL